MKISIIITHHQEPEEVVKPLLASIETQFGLTESNHEIILVEDGKQDQLSRDFLGLFNLEIKQISIPKSGVSAARNKGISEASGEYIIFCDADDRLFSCDTLWKIINMLDFDAKNKREFDFYVTNFLNQMSDKEEKLNFIPMRAEFIHLHGKIYSRKFLEYNKIKFPAFDLHEDSYFNAICRSVSDNNFRVIQDFMTYVWVQRPESITNVLSKEGLPLFSALIHQASEALKELKRRDNKYLELFATQFSYHIYFLLQTEKWSGGEYKKDYDKALELARAWYKAFKKIIEKVKPELHREFYMQELQLVANGLSLKDLIPFNQFYTDLDSVEEKKK